MKKSTYDPRGSSKIEPQAETIGRPGGFSGFLCTLGRVYITGVWGYFTLRNSNSFLLKKPSLSASVVILDISPCSSLLGLEGSLW